MRRRNAQTALRPSGSALLMAGFVLLLIVASAVHFGGPWLSAAIIHAEIIAFTNSERERQRVAELREHPLLTRAAQDKAEDMARLGYFSHTGPGGIEPWAWIQKTGYEYRYAGENLAVRFSESHEVVQAWMASPSHRANVVKPQYTQIGVGVAEGAYEGQPATFVVQFFAAPTVATAGEAAPAAPVAALAGRVEGAEVSVVPAPSLWQRLIVFFASTLGLSASVVNTEQGGVYIGESGASTVR